MLNIDEQQINRDWIKYGWNEERIPPYGAEEFFEFLISEGITLNEFKKTGAYQSAIADGLIVNDQWVKTL